MPVFFPEQNGRQPFKVVLNRRDMLVYALERDEDQEKAIESETEEHSDSESNGYYSDDSDTPVYNRLVASFLNYHYVMMPGLSEWCEGKKGASVLLKPQKQGNEWVFISDTIKSFEIEQGDHVNSIENFDGDDVMYPVVFGDHFCYFLLDDQFMPEDVVVKRRNKLFKERHWDRDIMTYEVLFESNDSLKRPMTNVREGLTWPL